MVYEVVMTVMFYLLSAVIVGLVLLLVLGGIYTWRSDRAVRSESSPEGESQRLEPYSENELC